MRTTVYCAVLGGMTLLAACGQQAGPKQEAAQQQAPPPVIPMKDFFRNPEKSGYQISQDGQYFAFRAPWHNRMNIFAQKVGDSTATQVTTDTVRDVGGYFWKGDRLLYSRDINGDENMIVFSASRDGKDVKALTPQHGVRAGVMDDLHDVPGMEKSVMVQMNKRNPEVFDPYLVNIETGDTKPLYDNSKENFEGWVTDHAGVIRIATKTDGTDQLLFYRASAKEPFKQFMKVGLKDSFQPHMFTFDNKNIYAASNLNGRDKTAIVEYDIAANKEVKEIYANKDYDVDGIDYSRKRKVLTRVVYTGEKMEEVFLDDQTKKLYEGLKAQFPGMEVSVVSENDNEDKRTVWVGSDKVTGRFYYQDDATNKPVLLVDRTPWIKEDQMADMKPITYTSRDGLTIHGYLTLPKGREAKGLPLVVNPHGGPWARDEWGFNSEAQFLANRGYAVLQMNFRGSTGYGRKFWEASFKQWGKTMQNDITDGVEWLVKQGTVDPKRIAIYGGSYGGYATLAGVTFTPDLYACAVDYVGVSDLFTFQRTMPPYWGPYRETMYEQVGHPVRDSLLLEEASPARHADQIKAPLFIAQGANDPRVKRDQSDKMVEALRKRGITVQYMVKENEGHGFHNEENRFDFYEAMDKFLDKYIGSGYGSAATAAPDSTKKEG